MWDQAYPTGVCTGGTDPHCGGTFVPGETDQQLYFHRPEQSIVSLTGGSEGIFTVDPNLNWSVKLSQTLYNTIKIEGNTGHGGPMFRRGEMGMSFYCTGDSTNVRIIWGPTLYK